jgi:hypothetical protein
VTDVTRRAEYRSVSGLRVPVVTSSYPPLVGLVERQVHEVARRMAASGTDATLLTITG